MEKVNPFGIEIEFEGPYLRELAKSFYKTDLPILFPQLYLQQMPPIYTV